MTTVPINDITPKNGYVATAGQTVFPYTYFVFDEDDLQVYVNQVQVTTGFTVSNLQDVNGGNVTFDVGLSAGDIVVLVRCSTIERLSEFQTSGAFFASSVNLEYTYGVVVDQDLRRKINDSLRLADFETETVKMQLPGVTGEDGSYLRLDLDTDTGEYCWTFVDIGELFGDMFIEDGSVSLDKLADGDPNTILGYDDTGAPAYYTAGANVTIDGATNTISANAVPSSTLTFQEEGAALVGAPHDTLNVVSDIAQIVDSGGGLATLTIAIPPGSIDDTDLADSGVVAGSYTLSNITVDAKGRVTAAASGERLNNTDLSGKADTAIAETDVILFGDTSDSDNLKKDTVQGILDLVVPPLPAATGIGAFGLFRRNGGILGSGATTAGSGLFYAKGSTGGLLNEPGAGSPPGTWRNMSGTTLSSLEFGLFQRIS